MAKAAPKSSHWLIKTSLVVFLVIVVFWGYVVFAPHQIPNQRYSLVIGRHQSLHKVANQLESAGVISSPRLLVLLARLQGKDKKVIAGMYILNHPMSLWDIIERITNGHPDEISVTILEGWNFRQIRASLDSESELTHLTTSMSESQILAALKINSPRMEGLLYPSTYFVAPGQSDLEVLHNAYNLMQNKLTSAWQSKNNNTMYQTPYQLLTMASLIQKETSNESDMVLISTVFNNRLRTNMRLQDDPAVFYGLNNKATIVRADFAIDTPYNTYLHNGLPPTPICTPSQAAIDAAARPTNDKTLLYFIAIGNGKSTFSATYQEHNQAINKYLKKK